MLNDALEAERIKIFSNLSLIPHRSQLGSSDLKLFVDENEVYNQLHDAGNGLSHAWKKKQLSELADSFDVSPPTCSLNSDEKLRLQSTLIAGDRCGRCVRARSLLLAKTKNFRRVVKEAFRVRGGSTWGLHFDY